MSTKDDSTQFQFLITCIKNSNAGKVDFGAVAEQLGIVSKGAAAKRYERLMKAHGIGPNGIAGTASPKKAAIKKEKGAGKSPAKKRKLEEVDENAGDDDEPIKDENIKGEVKSEVKCEVKFEDAMNVKLEHGSGGMAITDTGAPNSTLSSSHGNDEDDDDDVLVVSATERSSSGNVPAYGSSDHHHHHHHMSMSTQHIPSIHSPFDYATNMGFPLQTTPTSTMMTTTTMMPRSSSGNPLPYGFAPSPYAHSHDGHHFFWQGPGMMPTHPDGGHKEDPTDRSS
ncbi:hypothetical protein PFICI_09367 [Pestalotiopsis fici W106-1]|uniref:Myb-like DNA-binding domain-containing protein n=1 Tax=Pestalotiopsis fici (strain W106-1 / CGMCC3.15140) TaxID=1229662 RepID=W3X0F9_PESFW|nr:uncharacterized protein PFICI_09367 [Pestalotiopsis fici W106-1]ETS79514.1 hypothetical protein PFICI_09367 [Pestalotiopsis fici W106-1]